MRKNTWRKFPQGQIQVANKHMERPCNTLNQDNANQDAIPISLASILKVLKNRLFHLTEASLCWSHFGSNFPGST